MHCGTTVATIGGDLILQVWHAGPATCMGAALRAAADCTVLYYEIVFCSRREMNWMACFGHRTLQCMIRQEIEKWAGCPGENIMKLVLSMHVGLQHRIALCHLSEHMMGVMHDDHALCCTGSAE